MGRRQILDNRRRRSQMNALLRRFDGRCWWCKRKVRRAESGAPTSSDPDIATRDHLRSYHLDQKWLAANLVLACRLCNNQRAHRTPDQWVKVLRQRGLDHDWYDIPPLEWGIPHPIRPPKDPHAPSLWPSDDQIRTTDAAPIRRAFYCDSPEQLGEAP